MIIDGREISRTSAPYIIAEISCNHGGNLERALKLIQAAKEVGADAVKFQAYTADSITIDHPSSEFRIQNGLWAGAYLHSLYTTTQTPFEWFPILFQYAKTKGITAFASVFDKTSVEMLEKLNCPAYKIASMEITDIPLIRYAAACGKPLILSTGMANKEEIREAAVAGQHFNTALLACTSGYPTNVNNGALYQFSELREDWPVRWIGISDHTPGHNIPIAATAMGARFIEKHLMLGDEHTEDYEFSLGPLEFGIMVKSVHDIWEAMHKPSKTVEEPTRQMRRSLYVVKDIAEGEIFTEYNVRSIRPAYGMEPKKLPWVLTKRAATNLKRGTALKVEHVAP